MPADLTPPAAGTDQARTGDVHQIRLVGNEIAWGSTCRCLWRGELHDNEQAARREHADHVQREVASGERGAADPREAAIAAGDTVIVTDAIGNEHFVKATTGIVRGRDMAVVWVECHLASGGTDNVPWPAEYVRPKADRAHPKEATDGQH